jgi:nucleoside-triphosphatase THEP1
MREESTMKLGYVSVQGKGRIDLLLAEVVERLEAHGVAMAGTVQTNIERSDRPRCDMELRLLPDGPTVRISEDRGGQARGCRLDAGALEQSVVWVAGALEKAELLVVNKFGKQEADGKGLAGSIADALERGLPVLVGVNRLNLPAFLAFADGMAQELAPDAARVADWCFSVLAATDVETDLHSTERSHSRVVAGS